MMSGMPLKTCWAFNKFWNNKFYYKAASCWLVLLIHTAMHGYMNIKKKKILLEKLTGSQLLKKFPAFYGTRRFVTAFTTACHLSLTWATAIQSMPSTSHFFKIHFILSSHLCSDLPSGPSPLDLPTKMPCPSHSSWYDDPNIWWAVQVTKHLVM